MPFQEHYPLEAFTTGFRTIKSLTGDTAATKKHMDEVFYPAVTAHLTLLREAGKLAPTSGLAGRDMWLATEWNEMVETGKFSRWLVSAITSLPFHSATIYAMREDDDCSAEQRIRNAWGDLCAMLDRGTSHLGWRIEPISDALTGDLCRLDFKDWTAILKRWDGSGYVIARDAEDIPLASIEIDCPSGEIILSDCFDMADGLFHDTADIGPAKFTTASGNSAQGSINRTTITARKFGFAEIATDNTCVAVHVQGDRLLVSERWPSDDRFDLEDSDGDVIVSEWAKAGSFSCDRWTAVIADRQIVMDLLSKGGIEHPGQMIDQWIEEEDDEVVVLKMAPGRYRISFGPDFERRVDRAAHGIPEGPQPWLVMERIATEGIAQ